MKLLMVSACLPQPSWGASTRNYHLLKALASRHQVTLVALANSDEPASASDLAQLSSFAPTLRVFSRPISSAKRWEQLINVTRGRSYSLNLFILSEVEETLNAMLTGEHYDAVIYESVLTAGYRLRSKVKVIIDQHNIEHELVKRTSLVEQHWLRKWYARREYHLLKQGELERCRNADLVLVASERESQLLKSMLAEKSIHVVPNGVDIETFSDDFRQQEVNHQIIFTGAMNYYPNIHAVLFFAQHCWPLIRAQIPDATWLIVGRKPAPQVQRLAELPGVTVTGEVPDTRPYLAASSLALAPLLIGSGTRLKILEALAMHKAVVSTSIGCEGLAVVPGRHLMIEDQPEKFAQAVVALLNDSERRRALGAAGRALVETEYSWERCGGQLLHALEQIG
ncbi:MAG TPA: glycosyltransferase [Ktedonobacteraceae bacterium]|nr:glycosyltransferase [Ktedonobacteraceae bacterium]